MAKERELRGRESHRYQRKRGKEKERVKKERKKG